MKSNISLSVGTVRRIKHLNKSIDETRNSLTSMENELAGLSVKGDGVNESVTASGRARNKMTMAAGIYKLTKTTPKDIGQIVTGLEKLGYKFSAARPSHSVGAYLYGKLGKKSFKNSDSKFSPRSGVTF